MDALLTDGRERIVCVEVARNVYGVEVADRILVLAKGRQVTTLERPEISLERVVNLAFGIEREAA